MLSGGGRSLFALLTCLLLSTAVSCTELDTIVRSTPRVQWAQRTLMLYVRIVAPEAQISNDSIVVNDTHVSFSAPHTEGTWQLQLHFYRKVESRLATVDVSKSGIQLTVPKKWSARYWPRLLNDHKDTLKSFVGVDWKRWKAEEEDNPNLDQNDGWDEDEQALRPADYPQEAYDDTVVPLLTEQTFAGFVGAQNITAVLFFERATRDSQLLHFVFTTVAEKVKEIGVSVAYVDGKENGGLAKRLQVPNFPTTKLFFNTGEVFVFDAKSIAQIGWLGRFLKRQTESAWTDLGSANETSAFLDLHPKAVLGYFQSPKAASVFEYTAKRFRADADPNLYRLFAKLNTNAAEALSLDPRLAQLPENFTGVAMVKKGEALEVYTGNMKWKQLHAWVYNTQFNALEEITRWNFEAFRKRSVPILYVLLDDDLDTHDPLLDSIKPVAEKFYGRISFVYTQVNGSGDLLEHLRCEHTSVTYAVLEDFKEEYRYCISTDSTSPLTPARIEKLVEAYSSRSITPDHIRSEPAPVNDAGPVCTVVADTLMQTVMNPEKDVVIAFYAEMDDKWEETEAVYEKVAIEYEEIPTLHITKIEGMRNERPKEFPDIGYFPCTWIFPALNKMQPMAYNNSAGMIYSKLKTFINTYASFPPEPQYLQQEQLALPHEETSQDAAADHMPAAFNSTDPPLIREEL
eukprot:jgi/Chlat1/3852/Chrsp26S04155